MENDCGDIISETNAVVNRLNEHKLMFLGLRFHESVQNTATTRRGISTMPSVRRGGKGNVGLQKTHIYLPETAFCGRFVQNRDC